MALLFSVPGVHAVPGGRAPDESEIRAPDVREIAEPESEEPLPIERIEARPLTAVDARGAALLLSGETGGDFEGAVLWTSGGPAAGDEKVSVQVFVEVDGGGLLAGSAGSRQTIEVFFYVVNESGDVAGHLAQSMVLDGSKYVERVRETGLRFVGDFQVARGLYSIRTLVRNRGTMKYFLASRDFDIRFDASSAPILLPPLVKEKKDVWVTAGEQGLLVPSILQGISGMDVWPSAAPVARAGDRIEMVVGCSELTSVRNLSARLVDHSGSQLLNLDLEIGAGIAASSDLTFYSAAVVVAELPVGRYRLDIVVSEDEKGRSVSQSLPVWIHDDGDSIVWTDAVANLAAEAAQDEPESVDPTVEEQQERALPEAYVGPKTFTDFEVDRWEPIAPVTARPLRVVDARGAALLLSGQKGGQVEGALIWSSSGPPEEGDLVSVQILVEVDGSGLLSGSEGPKIPIEIYGYLLDETGTVVGHLAEGILLDGGRPAAAVASKGLKFVGEIRVQPGHYSLRILVRNRESRKFFLVRRNLDVRFDLESNQVLLPPLVAEPDESWVFAAKPGLEIDEVRGLFPGMTAWPSAMPGWRAEDSLEMVVGCSELIEGRHLSARLINMFGSPILDPDLEIGPPVALDRGLGFYRVSVAAPDVPEGRYRFEMVVTDADTGQSATQSLPVLIHGVDTAIVWTDAAAPIETDPEMSSPAVVEMTAEQQKGEAMRDAYLEALRLWSAGEKVAARRRMAELERPIEAAGLPRLWRQLINLERATAVLITRDDPAGLMGVAFLHRDMFSWYVARREMELARHSWQMVSAVARMSRSRSSWDGADEFSECVLLDLATHLARTGLMRPAREVLDIAVQVAPDSATALLGLGALYERSGLLREAVEEFKTLNQIRPDHQEGRLRLAVNRSRLGADKEAEELFRSLLSPSSPKWIRAVAFQELGRLLLRNGRGKEAEELVGAGMLQIPDNQHLPILMAHALDQGQRPRAATAVIEELDARGLRHTTSPRYRYSQWPDLDRERVQLTLEDAEAAGLAALREAL
jgi:tetratricopeptide (TPR) repeat protein